MELQFQKKVLPCMRQILSQCREQELTQEVRLSEGLPDIGKVLGVWGQVLVRGKEWRSDSVAVSGGLMLWIMYMDEDGVQPQVVETWLPFHSKWEIPDVDNDGSIMFSARLSFADARLVSARKLMLRIGISMSICAFVRQDAYIYEPEQSINGLQLKTTTYPMMLPAELGEKSFSLDEQVPIPSDLPEPDKILRYSLQPRIVELKVLGGRVVFRGMAMLHMLYKSCSDESLHSCDVELPFSQYAQLDREYEEGAEAVVKLVVTNLELDMGENKMPVLKAGLTGQYMIRDRKMIPIVEDAYSPEHELKLQFEQLLVPNILEEVTQNISAERPIQIDAQRIADVEFLPLDPEAHSEELTVDLQLGGRFQVLYYDRDGKLQSASAKWDQLHRVQIGDGVRMIAQIQQNGKPFASINNGIELHGQINLELTFGSAQGFEMISAIEGQERKNRDDNRPSLLIRRAGEDDLWTIAKNSGSSVEAIKSANGLLDEPATEQILLIPVL